MTLPGDLFAGLADLLGSGLVPEEVKREVAQLKTRAATAEGRLDAIRALCADPGESHRMLTRKEILRLCDGR